MKQSQNLRILKFLKNGGKLTSEKAMKRFRCFRAASRIHDLRRQGVDIDAAYINIGNTRYAQYTLAKKS